MRQNDSFKRKLHTSKCHFDALFKTNFTLKLIKKSYIRFMITKKQSTFLLLALTVYIIYKVFENHIPVIYSWDLFGSYIYLPMLFDQHNLIFTDFSYFESINNEHQLSSTLYQFVLNENGRIMTKYTVGWSILMSPFYFVAEIWASIFGFKTDGFSYPYKIMLVVGNLSYFMLAIFQLRKLFKRFFNETLAITLIFLLFLGTNLLFSQYASLGSTHLIEFLLLILFINQCFNFYEKLNLKSGSFLAVLLALIFLVRPPDVIFGLIPVLWRNEQFPTFKIKLFYFIRQKKAILASVIAIYLLLISIQFMYWKITSGKFMINSYANNPGEGFDWFTPYIYEILFSFRKGWFIYTPISLLCILGFYIWYKKDKNSISFLIPFIIFFYIISCWTTWWYADSYSLRAVLEVYPLLFIALGFLIQKATQSKLKFIIYPLITICVILNLFQTFQIENGILKTDRMTKDYYCSVFGQTTSPNEKQENLLSIDRDKQQVSPLDLRSGFRKSKTINYHYNPVFTLTKDSIYTPVIEFKQVELSTKPYFVIQAKWSYLGASKNLNGKIFSATTLFKDQAYGWFGKDISQKDFKIDTLKHEVYFQYLTPHFRTKNDLIRLGVWNQSGENISFSKVEISIYEPKIIRD
ncbi:MAG: hypothetical protein ACK5B9_09765 [Flavobacteriia bacterium]|jgi:hypothetical protein